MAGWVGEWVDRRTNRWMAVEVFGDFLFVVFRSTGVCVDAVC